VFTVNRCKINMRVCTRRASRAAEAAERGVIGSHVQPCHQKPRPLSSARDPERSLMRRLSPLAALVVSCAVLLPACNGLASRNRVQAINRMNEGIQLFDRNNTAGAEKAIQDAIQLDPSYAAAHHTLGQIYKKQNKMVDAEKAFMGAIENMKAEPQAEYWYDLGAVQQAQGEADGEIGRASGRERVWRAWRSGL